MTRNLTVDAGEVCICEHQQASILKTTQTTKEAVARPFRV